MTVPSLLDIWPFRMKKNRLITWVLMPPPCFG